MSFRHPSSRQMYRSYRSDEMESASPVYGFCGRRSNYLLGAGILLALIGASLLVAFGLLYVQPYIDIRHLVESECMTEDTVFADELVSCTCASDASGSCMSQYPCIHISVNYTKESGDVVFNATLYDSYETYILQSSAQQVSYLSDIIRIFLFSCFVYMLTVFKLVWLSACSSVHCRVSFNYSKSICLSICPMRAPGLSE